MALIASFTRRLLPPLGLSLALAAPAWAQEPIRIGSFLSVTGPASFLGDPEQNTRERQVEKVNAECGMRGRKPQWSTNPAR